MKLEESPGDPTEGEAVSADIYSYRAGIIGGSLGGLGMAIVAVVTGVFTGLGVWFPLNLVGATLVRSLQTAPSATLAEFNLAALIAGFVLHMVLSVGLGVVFVTLLPTLPGNPLVWSVIVGGMLWFIAQFAVLPIFNPLMASEVHIPSFFVAHLVYTLTLGVVVLRSEPTWKMPSLSQSRRRTEQRN